MKTKTTWMVLAALLLSTGMWAQNVAKVANTASGALVGEYATMTEALAAWTDGTTLTMLSNATYDATATDTIKGTRTLDLNGKILTWNTDFGSTSQTGVLSAIDVEGELTIKASAADDATQKGTLALNVSHNQSTNLCAILVGMTQTTTAKLVATDGVNIVGNFATAPTYTKYDANNVPTKQTVLTSSVVFPVNGAMDIENADIRMQGECGIALNIPATSGDIVCANNTITYEAGTPTVCVGNFYGINATKAGIVLDNNKVDLSAVNGTVINSNNGKTVAPNIYALKIAKTNISIKGSESLYKVDATGTNNYSVYGGTSYVLSIEDGVFVGKLQGGFVVSGGKFTHKPDAKYVAANSYFEKEGEYYVVKHGKSYIVRINGVDYLDTDDWGAVCSHSADTYTEAKIIAHTDFSIPEGAYVLLGFATSTDAEKFSAMTITNNGNLRLGTSWKRGSFVNNGMMEISVGATFGEKSATAMQIVNNATGKLFVKPSASMATILFKDYFTLTNNGGQVEVSYGKFTEKAFAQIYKEGEYNYIANGYIHPKQADRYYHIIAIDDVVATVNEVEYENLYYAIQASSEEYPAVLQRDCTRKSKFAFQLTKRKTCVLDLNGKTLTLDYSAYPEDKKQEFFALRNIDFTIQGSGTIEGDGDILFSMNGNNKPATNYTVLTIGKDVTIRQTDGWYAIAAISPSLNHGIVVNFNGKVDAQCAFYVNGTFTNTTESAPIFNIGSTATFDCSSSLAYAAGYARWTYAGNATVGNFGVEVRAGEFTMNGGSIISTATQPADDQFNGSGSTSQATAIAVCQHSTNLPINVVVNDGYIKAYTPLYQANPNTTTNIEQINLTVNGGKFYSTSNNIVWSLNKRIVLNDGLYNINPSAYAADGKVVVANTGTDAATYPWTIGDKDADVTFSTSGAWDVSGNWSNGTVATAATSAVIDANVIIGNGVRAYAYGIKVNEGKTITIENGGVLVVGKDGISGITSADQLKIEDGGNLLISPAATANNQPLASVVKTLNTYQKAAGTFVAGVEDEYVRCYMGSVTTSKPTVDKAYTWYGSYWDYASGWQQASPTTVPILSEPFRGFAMTTATASAPGTPVTMKGTLVGNAKASLSMHGKGFHFFANSWMAPLDAYEVLNQLDKLRNEGKVESSLKILLPLDVTIGDDDWSAGTFVDVNRSFLRLGNNSEYWGTIAPMAGFFLRANEQVSVDLEYEQAVWNVMLAAKQSAPRRVMSAAEDNITGVRILLMSSDGRKDRLYVYNGAPIESITKMPNEVPNVNIYAENAGGKYSTYATEVLSGTEIGIQCNASAEYVLSFDYAEGEVLYLKDLQTGIVTEMSDGATYTFTAEPNTTATRFRIVSRSEVTTGVDDATTGTTTDTTPTKLQGIYSVTGQYLGTADQLPTLPAGVYIINGKKVVK